MLIRKHLIGFLITILIILGCVSTSASEYFVGKHGNNGNDGRSIGKAFLTVKKGVGVLQPGDTLTIGPGEYFENVRIEKFGDLEKETLIRAEIPGTVLLRGDVDAPAFSKLEGRRFVYFADFDCKVLSVNEVDSLSRLGVACDIDALEFKPGSWYYDESNKKLYISTSDFQPPDHHHYTIGLLRGSGIRVEGSQRIVIDGLSASGFMTAEKEPILWLPEGGFLLYHTRNSTVRRCSSFLNQNGIGIRNDPKDDNGMGSLVDDCRTYGNQTDGIVGFWANNDTFSNSSSFLNGGCGIQFYAEGKGDLIFSNNLSWGNAYGDFRMKGLGLPVDRKTAFADSCISMDRFDVTNIKQCIIGGPNLYRNDTPPDNIPMPDNQEFRNREFADAANFDFHLQETSKFCQKDAAAPCKGPYPYEPNIFYVKGDGNDSLDGLSMANAWKTLGHAIKKVKSGDTIYIVAGRYSSDVPLNAKNVKVCGRGTEPVIVDGPFKVVDSEDTILERLYFASPVIVKNGYSITFNNCSFSGDETAVVKSVSFFEKLMLKEPEVTGMECSNVDGLRITHGIFKIPLKLKNCSKVFLGGNIYGSSHAVQVDSIDDVIYSSYNSYADIAKCWKANGKTMSFDELKETHDADSRILVPELSDDNGVLAVRNAHQFAGRGPLGSDIGNYREWQLRFMQLVGPFIYSVTDTTANLEWWTNLPVCVEMCWGDTPDCGNKVSVTQNSFYSCSLTGLEPGKKYYVKVKPLRVATDADPGRRFRIPKQGWPTVEFTTASKSADTVAQTYYVSNAGDNNQDGLTLQRAWKSLQHAADTVRPGDTVLIAGGKYPGTVYFRTSGKKGKPITFKAIPGEKVVVAGVSESMKSGLVLYGKQYYNFDAIYLQSYGGGDGSGAFLINGGSNIQLTRCHYSAGWGTAILADGCRDMLIKNCVFMSSMFSAMLQNCPNLRVENNVFVSPLIHHLTVGGTKDEPARVANNIFGESTRGKQQVCFVTLSENTQESNNCFFLFWPENERMVMNSLTLPEYRAAKPTDSFVSNPQMPGALGFLQGWQRTSSRFEDLFAANPELVRRGIGLQPEAFRDFNFKMDWPYDATWAGKMLAGKKVAADLVKSGKDAEALSAYTDLSKMPMHDLLKSEILEEFALCANRLKQYDQAIAIAKSIPLKPLSVKCQMKIMVDNGKYAELIKDFSNKSLDCAPHLGWICPDLEYLFVDVYAYRSTAYAETGDLKSAEADLKVMLKQQKALGFDSGVGINELAWLRMGDFYRKYLKEDIRALDAYSNVISRTFQPWYETKPIPKPVLTGDSETLRAAVQAASEILRKQGRGDEVLKIQASVRKARAEVLAVLGMQSEALAQFKEITDADKSLLTSDKLACEKRIDELPDVIRKTLIGKIGAADDLTEKARRFLINVAGGDDVEARKIALRSILAFAPEATIRKMLNETEEDAAKKAGSVKIKPTK